MMMPLLTELNNLEINFYKDAAPNGAGASEGVRFLSSCVAPSVQRRRRGVFVVPLTK